MGLDDLFSIKELNKYFDHEGCRRYDLEGELFVGETVGDELMYFHEQRQLTVLAKQDCQLVYLTKNIFKKHVYEF